jgi:hypothetical protein
MGLHSQLINDSGGTIRLSSIAPEGLIDTVSFQPKTSRFFVAGFAESALLVDTQGKLIRRIEFRNSSVASFFRQIVLADPHSTDFLLIGQQPETLKMFLLRFSSNGTQRGPAKRLNVTGFLQGAAFNSGKGEILLLLGDFDTLHTSQLNPQFDVVSTRVLGNYRSGDLGSSNLVFAQGKYIVAYSRDEKLWMRMLGPNGNPIGNELGLGPIMDFSFRKSILYSPLENVGLLIWETAPVSDIRHVFARRFRID